MDDDLRTLIHGKLASAGLLEKNWSRLLLAACDGHDALEGLLKGGQPTESALEAEAGPNKAAGAFLASISVQGFRGIGSKQTLPLTPGPGLTIVVGRNGSGKSSFAEAVEVLFTGDSKRWSERSKIWKEGWRNLHQSHPAEIEAEVLLEGQGRATITCAWSEGSQLDAHTTHVQPKGKRKTTLRELGWTEALISYRPFLSYNELSSMLDEGPSKLYDALSLVLGLEDLVAAQTALSQSRLDRQRAMESADQVRKALIERIKALLAQDTDSRASACLDALTSKSWGISEVAAIVAAGTVPQAAHDTGVLTRAASLEPPDAERVQAAAASLRAATAQLEAISGSDAERSRQIADLLESALMLHAEHGSVDCPVCSAPGALNADWAESSRWQITRLREAAESSDQVRRFAEQGLRAAHELLTAPPKLLAQLVDTVIDGLDVLAEEWPAWHAGASITQLPALADHLETRYDSFTNALDTVRKSAVAELKRREDRWRPIADTLSDWVTLAPGAKAVGEDVTLIKAAEAWLKDASADIRNERFAPIADQAMAAWQHLRQHSNVELGRIELIGTKSQRRVSLDVTVDGVPGAALGVMSQGELHALALSLFLPRATLPESPFRFVVIDDPVQSMDPARVDGLAKALEDTAQTRQVIVFTHDERLTEAVRRLNVKSRVVGLTRRPKSLVEVRTALDPTSANIEDALALVQTTHLPGEVLRRLVPGFCRAALEASFIDVFRRRRLTNGRLHSDVEEELRGAGKLTLLAALVLFDDRDKGGDVMKRLNQFGPWAGDLFKQCNEGAHHAVAADLKAMIRDTERLTVKILEMK